MAFFKIILSIIIFFILSCFINFPVLAIDINPTVVELSLSDNNIKTGFYTVHNTTAQKVKINVEPETYYGVNLKKWLRIYPTFFVLKPNEKKKVYYTVNTKSKLKIENCAHIYFKQSPLKKASSGMGIIIRMGSSFYLSRKGKELFNPEFKDIEIINKNRKLFLKVRIKNNGNVHLRFFYKIIIYNSKKQEIYANEFEHLTAVIPGAEKKLETPIKLKNILTEGDYSSKIIFSYGNTLETQKTESKNLKFKINYD